MSKQKNSCHVDYKNEFKDFKQSLKGEHFAYCSLSFCSNDCTSQLFQAIFPDSDVAKKFASSRTKTAGIIAEVLALYVKKVYYLTLVPSPFQSRLMPPFTRN